MTTIQARRDRAALTAIVVLLAGICFVDSLTPLGYAEWALYLLPVAATLFQSHLLLPLYVAAVATVLSAVGYQMSPPGVNVTIAIFNRCLGAAVHWATAIVVWRVLTTRAALERVTWLQEGRSDVSRALLGEQSLETVSRSALRTLCALVEADVGAIYRYEKGELIYVGSEGADPAALSARMSAENGLAGQIVAGSAARAVMDVPPGHLDMLSTLGRSAPRHLAIGPLTADGKVYGVVEVGFARHTKSLARELELLALCAEPIGLALRSAVYRERLVELLEETQRQGEAMQTAQEELRVTNEELEEQSRALQESQARLESQQAELEQTNVQLEEQTELLERQKRVLLDTQGELQSNAERLESASRYKSEFLANMSHELRTPLNSSLILSKLLADNREGTLTPAQVKHAQAIHSSNSDLLTLINDILDLSKIEAGHVELMLEDVSVEALTERLMTTFKPLTHQKGLQFAIESLPGAPKQIRSDAQRLQQVLTNLLANAVKFTKAGEVRLRIQAAPDDRIRFLVSDTGTGIPKHQQEVIFEAFRQADGSTSRRFGGTGLGLSISRELAHRMGGDITVDSEPGRGSCFTLELPVMLQHAVEEARPAPSTPASSAPTPQASRAPSPQDMIVLASAETTTSAPVLSQALVPDDRAALRHPGRMILAIEDDRSFAEALLDLIRERDFDGVIASTAAEGIALARELKPSGILLDIMLPDASGLSVLEQLKRDPATRHVPVHMMSSLDRTHTAMELGAIGHLIKPATRVALSGAISQLESRLQRDMRRLLIVEDDADLRESLKVLLADSDVQITAVGTVADALDALSGSSFDCMVTDLALPDGSGYDLLERMAGMDNVSFPPVIVYTGRALTRDEEQQLRRYSKSIIVKGARSPERLLDEATLFLHSVESALPPERQRMLRQARQRDAVLDGRCLLLAEDDVRNIFALSSVFEPLGAQLAIARNGREAIERLEQGDVDLVLMDIMMPEMDGLTAMRLIRQRPEWRELPIIALTAKAMPEDRERCLQAGANDYVSKPIDVDKLVSLCRVWCPK